MKNKILSLFLTLVMVFGMFTFMGGETHVHAAKEQFQREIQSVYVTMPEASAGGYSDIDVSVRLYTEGGTSITDFEVTYAQWTMDGSPFGGRFEEGHTYTFTCTITVGQKYTLKNAGAVFVSNGSYTKTNSSMTCTVTYELFKSCALCGTRNNLCDNCNFCVGCVPACRLCDSHCKYCTKICQKCGVRGECCVDICNTCGTCSDCAPVCQSCGSECSWCSQGDVCEYCNRCVSCGHTCEQYKKCAVDSCKNVDFNLCEVCMRCYEHCNCAKDKCESCYKTKDLCWNCDRCKDCCNCGNFQKKDRCAKCGDYNNIFCKKCSTCEDCTRVCGWCDQSGACCYDFCAVCDKCQRCCECGKDKELITLGDCCGQEDIQVCYLCRAKCNTCAWLCVGCGICIECVDGNMCTTDYYCENCVTLCTGISISECDAGCSNHSTLCKQCGRCESCAKICPDCKKICGGCSTLCDKCGECEKCCACKDTGDSGANGGSSGDKDKDETHTHTASGGKIKNNKDGHWYVCGHKGCNEIVKDTMENHQYSDDNDTDCNVCGYKRKIEVHKHSTTKVNKVAATCEADGCKEYYTCDSCGKIYTDKKATIEISDLNEWKNGEGKIPALGHDFSEQIQNKAHLVEGTGTCTSPAQYYYDCANCKTVGTTIWVSEQYGDHEYDTSKWDLTDASGHGRTCLHCGTVDKFAAHKPGKEATETTAQTCTVCGYVIAPATAHEHELVKVDAVEATCTENGSEEYYYCTSCEWWFKNEFATITITDKESIIVKASAKYHKDENTDDICDVCGEKIEDKSESDPGTVPEDPGTPDRPDTSDKPNTSDGIVDNGSDKQDGGIPTFVIILIPAVALVLGLVITLIITKRKK